MVKSVAEIFETLATAAFFTVMGTILVVTWPIRWVALKVRYLVTKLRG